MYLSKQAKYLIHFGMGISTWLNDDKDDTPYLYVVFVCACVCVQVKQKQWFFIREMHQRMLSAKIPPFYSGTNFFWFGCISP